MQITHQIQPFDVNGVIRWAGCVRLAAVYCNAAEHNAVPLMGKKTLQSGVVCVQHSRAEAGLCLALLAEESSEEVTSETAYPSGHLQMLDPWAAYLTWALRSCLQRSCQHLCCRYMQLWSVLPTVVPLEVAQEVLPQDVNALLLPVHTAQTRVVDTGPWRTRKSSCRLLLSSTWSSSEHAHTAAISFSSLPRTDGKAFLQRQRFPCPRAKKGMSQYSQKNWNLSPFKYVVCTKCRAGWCQTWGCFSLLNLPGVPEHLCWQWMWAPLPSTTLSPSCDLPPTLHGISPLRAVVCNTGATKSLSCTRSCRAKWKTKDLQEHGKHCKDSFPNFWVSIQFKAKTTGIWVWMHSRTPKRNKQRPYYLQCLKPTGNWRTSHWKSKKEKKKEEILCNGWNEGSTI